MSITMDYKAMERLLESRLKPKRFQHSLGVADTAVFLAKRFGVNVEQARIAGLLHDCAREYKNSELPAEAARRGITYGAIETASPLLLHAYVGACRVKELYGVDDQAISQAIYRHTVGGANMTDLDKIIYFADMIEPARDYPQVEALRKLARTVSLDEMLLEAMNQSIIFVAQKNQLLHPDTITARNELLLKQR